MPEPEGVHDLVRDDPFSVAARANGDLLCSWNFILTTNVRRTADRQKCQQYGHLNGEKKDVRKIQNISKPRRNKNLGSFVYKDTYHSGGTSSCITKTKKKVDFMYYIKRAKQVNICFRTGTHSNKRY